MSKSSLKCFSDCLKLKSFRFNNSIIIFVVILVEQRTSLFIYLHPETSIYTFVYGLHWIFFWKPFAYHIMNDWFYGSDVFPIIMILSNYGAYLQDSLQTCTVSKVKKETR